VDWICKHGVEDQAAVSSIPHHSRHFTDCTIDTICRLKLHRENALNNTASSHPKCARGRCEAHDGLFGIKLSYLNCSNARSDKVASAFVARALTIKRKFALCPDRILARHRIDGQPTTTESSVATQAHFAAVRA
jgi:hypothetical protein